MKKAQIVVNESLKLTCDYENFLDQKDKFICRQLDIFDHCLTEEESSRKILSYPVLKSKKIDLSQYLAKEQFLLSFLIELYNKYKVIFCADEKHFIYDSLVEYKKSCISFLREKKFVTLHIPELHLTIYGNYDLNMPFNFLASNPESVVKVETLLKNFDGLYLL